MRIVFECKPYPEYGAAPDARRAAGADASGAPRGGAAGLPARRVPRRLARADLRGGRLHARRRLLELHQQGRRLPRRARRRALQARAPVRRARGRAPELRGGAAGDRPALRSPRARVASGRDRVPDAGAAQRAAPAGAARAAGPAARRDRRRDRAADGAPRHRDADPATGDRACDAGARTRADARAAARSRGGPRDADGGPVHEAHARPRRGAGASSGPKGVEVTQTGVGAAAASTAQGGVSGLVSELLARDRWSRERVLAHREEHLRALLRHAVEHSPYYRETIGDADGVDVEALPTLPKATLVAEYDRIVTDPRLRLEALEAHLAGPDPGGRLLDRYRAFAT